jgi:gluconate kinase
MKSLRLSRPHAIMMVGIPGSGKTFFAEKFAEMFNAPFINTSIIESACKEGEAGRVIGYMVNEIAKTQQTFVYEGNADTRVSRTEFGKWARTSGYQPLYVWVQIDTATAKTRTKKTGVIGEDEFDFTVKSFSAPHPDERSIVISGKHTYATQAKVVLNHLSKSNRQPQSQQETQTPPVQPSQPPRTPSRSSIVVQ